MIDVSIIMPIYNVERYLERAIKSVLNQTHKNIELILVNDGSPDQSLQLCLYYKKEDKRVCVIDQKNTGAGYARNAGLAKAKGEYIYFVDPDDYIESNLIEDNLKIAQKTAADLVVFGFFEETTSKDNSSTNKVHTPKFPSSATASQFREQFKAFYFFTPYALWNKLYKRQYLLNHVIQFSNQKIGEDALFNLQVYRQIEKVEVNQKAYYHYIFRPNSAVNHYLTDRFKQEYTVASRFEELVNEWQISQSNQALIDREYWNTIYLELKNLSSTKCPLKKKEKINVLETIMNDKKLLNAVKALDKQAEKNRFVKALVYLMKHKKYAQALSLMQLRTRLGEKSQKGLTILKQVGYKKGV
ncbi:glycosyltransferase family 2 protein [Carnobacterium sp. TMP28]|uniref:glycosyltransferase family 2 protein n=1 Tax=Carnobacterium sp. TMP28 TaxID=3397060 RepID=UPI0039E146E9